MIDLLRTAKLTADISRILIIRLKSGPDTIHLESNWIDPCGLGPLSFSFPVPRDLGEVWVKSHFPGVEVRLYDYSIKSGILERPNRAVQAPSQQPAQLLSPPSLSAFEHGVQGALLTG